MPAKRLKQSKQVMEKLPKTDGKSLLSLIPIARKRGQPSVSPKFNPTVDVRTRGRPSLASKFTPTVDIEEALTRLGKGFFTGAEKDLFKTPLKVRPVDSQKQRQSSGTNLGITPPRSNKRSGSRNRGSPGSKTSSPESPYFLRSKGNADGVVDDSLLKPKRRQKSGGFDSVKKKGSARKTKSIGLASGDKASPAKRGRPPNQSPPHKKAEVEKHVTTVKVSGRSFSGGKGDKEESSTPVRRREKSVNKKRTEEPTASVKTFEKSRRRTQDSASEEVAGEAARVESGKKRKREELDDETDDRQTKRMKVGTTVESTKVQDVVQEPSHMATMKLVVHRANIKDLGDKFLLNSNGKQSSYGQVKETRHTEEKRKTQAKEVNQTKTRQSGTSEVTVVLTNNYPTSSQRHSLNSKLADSSALTGSSVQHLREATRNSDEMVRKQSHDLTENISVRSSWSAHLYDKGSSSASRIPRVLVTGNSRQLSTDAVAPGPLGSSLTSGPLGSSHTSGPLGGSLTLGPLGGSLTSGPLGGSLTLGPLGGSLTSGPLGSSLTSGPLGSCLTPSVDFQMNWDTSAIKEQLIGSVRPRRPSTDGLTIVADSQPIGKGLLEESVVGFTSSSITTPLRRPDKPLFESDVVQFGENTRSCVSRKTVCVEEKWETRSHLSSTCYPAVQFNSPPVQPLRGNGASLRRSVDRVVPAADRVNVIRGRSVEPGMIRGENIHVQPKFNNGKVDTKKLPTVVEPRGGRSGPVCKRLLCLVGTSVLAIGAVCLVQLALAAGYLGEIF